MTSNVIVFRAPFGIAGAVTREDQKHIEAQPLAAATPFASYGLPGKIVNGIFVPLTVVGDVTPYGFLVRPYPFQGPNASDPLGVSVPLTTGVANILRRGYIAVQCNAGTPALGGTVYQRYANADSTHPLDGIEAAAVGATTVALTNAFFMGPADANGLVEIGFNI